MPFWLDCYDFAARAIDSGVGLSLDRPLAFTADEVPTKLERLLTIRNNDYGNWDRKGPIFQMPISITRKCERRRVSKSFFCPT